MIPSVSHAIVEVLKANAAVEAWATGGIFTRRAPQKNQQAPQSIRDKYLVVRVSDSDPNESHTQGDAASVSKDMVDVAVWAKSDREAWHAANLVRMALDNWFGDAAGITGLRVFWRGTTDREVEDLSRAEQLIDGCFVEFEVGYRLPTGEP